MCLGKVTYVLVKRTTKGPFARYRGTFLLRFMKVIKKRNVCKRTLTHEKNVLELFYEKVCSTRKRPTALNSDRRDKARFVSTKK